MDGREFSPREALEGALARWWVVVLMTVFGGVVGWTFHFFRTPIYEATAGITVNTFLDRRDLSQYEMDLAFNAAGSVINSNQVMDRFVAEAQARGYSSSEVSWIRKNLSAEGMEALWLVHVRSHDPQEAAELANLWAGFAEQTLKDDVQHALLANELQGLIDGLQGCLPASASASTPEACSSYSLDEIQAKIQAWSDELAQEQSLRQGVASVTSVSWTLTASAPEQPVLYGKGGLVLAGACIGFFISLWITSVRKVRRRD